MMKAPRNISQQITKKIIATLMLTYLFSECIVAQTYQDAQQFTVADRGYITFDVKASDEVDISFSSSTTADQSLYKIMLGAFGNSMIMLDMNGAIHDESYSPDSGTVLDPNNFQTYWITFDSGVISIGQGSDLSQNVLYEWDLTQLAGGVPSTGIKYFSITSLSDGGLI